MADKFKVVVRLGTSDKVPILILGEPGWDVDKKQLRVGDDTAAPPIIPSNKSIGEVTYSQYFTPSYKTIKIQTGGTVGGLDLASMNQHFGLVFREADGKFSNREPASSSGYLTFELQNPGDNDPPEVTHKLDINPSESLLSLIAAGGGNKFTWGPNKPENPRPGDEWYSQTDEIIYKCVTTSDDPSKYYWIDIQSFTGGGSGVRFFLSDTPPGTAAIGDEWYDEEDSRTYKYLLSGGRGVWIDMQV